MKNNTKSNSKRISDWKSKRMFPKAVGIDAATGAIMGYDPITGKLVPVANAVKLNFTVSDSSSFSSATVKIYGA
jgi:hypothetical protein